HQGAHRLPRLEWRLEAGRNRGIPLARVSRFPARVRCMSVALPPFQRLLDTYAEDVYGFLHATVGATEADDCFQDTFLAALRAYPRLRHGDNLRSWLLTIAHRKAID